MKRELVLKISVLYWIGFAIALLILLNGCAGKSLDDMNREVAAHMAAAEKPYTLSILNRTEYYKRFFDTACHGKKGCYYKGKIFLSDTGQSYDVVYHEFAHLYGANETEAHKISLLFSD